MLKQFQKATGQDSKRANQTLRRLMKWGDLNPDPSDPFNSRIGRLSEDDGLADEFGKLSREAQDAINAIQKDGHYSIVLRFVFIGYVFESRFFKDMKAAGKPKALLKKIKSIEKAIESIREAIWFYGYGEGDSPELLSFFGRLKERVKGEVKDPHKGRERRMERRDMQLIEELFGIFNAMGLDTALVIEVAGAGYATVYGDNPKAGWMEYTLDQLRNRQE